MNEPRSFDFVILGGGPAGQKAAVQAAKAGRSVLIVDREAAVGGECVHRGTIPSKTLRESAVYLRGLASRAGELLPRGIGPHTKVQALMQRLEAVLAAHQRFMGDQLERNGIEHWRGRGRFVSPHEIDVTAVDGSLRTVRAKWIVVATGSRPRNPQEFNVDHEHVLDSDSILSLVYLPESLLVVGAGVIAAEFASVFQALGVKVTMVDRHERPVGFLDPELTDAFVRAFEGDGGRFVPCDQPDRIGLDERGRVRAELASGELITTDKALVALGRVPTLHRLSLENAGLEPNDRGALAVDEFCRTGVPHIYAAGDVAGPPALAAASMEQGRRAVRHALGLPLGQPPHMIPTGVYTVPEMASVGWTEAQANEREAGCVIGRASFGELARGQINGDVDGLLKLVADPSGERLLGAHVIGQGAAELVHLAQMCLLAGGEIDLFVENIFNFPTLAEAYRVAALDIIGQRVRRAA